MRPIAYSHRGKLHCCGILFDTALLAESRVIARVLQLWETGASLYQYDAYYVLLWGERRWLAAEESLGYPIVSYQGQLATAPLSNAFIEANELQNKQIWHLKNGDYLILSVHQSKRINPAQWFDISDFELVSVQPLGALPKPPVVVNETTEPDSHQVFKRLNFTTSNEQQQVLQQMANQAKSGSQSQEDFGGLRPVSLFTRLISSLWSGRGDSNEDELNRAVGDSGQNHSGAATPSGGPQRPQKSLRRSLRALFSNLILKTGYDRLLGRRQAAYFKKMAEMFEQGDLEEALKYAIPMSDVRDAIKEGYPGLKNFSRCAEVKMNTQRQQSGSFTGIGDAGLDYLTQMYEQAFQKLDRAGQVKEAAFVLAELLRQYSRAIDYLEKYKENELAAELAEGQQLPPARVIKQWILAGNPTRAIYVAKMTGCYLPAVELLMVADKKRATELAATFARLNADAGFYHQAVELGEIGSIDNDVLSDWLDKAIAAGGADNVTLLIKYLCVCEEDQRPLPYKALRTILNDRSPLGLGARQAIYAALKVQAETMALVPVARKALRSYVDDVGRGVITPQKNVLASMKKLGADPTLTYDINGLSLSTKKNKVPLLKNRSSVQKYQLLAGSGSNLTDVCQLNSKIILIAKGDAGLEVRTLDGRLMRRIAVTCHHIVRSDSCQQALLLGLHEQYTTISKFDAATQTAERWIELELGCWAASFDGFYWLVAHKDRIWALDTQADSARAVWSVNDLPGQVVALARSQQSFALVCSNDDKIDIWRYELPSLLLRTRDILDKQTLIDEQWFDLAADACVLMLQNSNDRAFFSLRKGQQKGNVRDPVSKGAVLTGQLSDHWLTLIMQSSEVSELKTLALYDRQGLTYGQCRLECDFPADAELLVDVQDDRLLLATQYGDIACFDLSSGTLLTAFQV